MNSDLPISVLWFATFLIITFYGVYSTILLWHWKKYGTGRFTTAANAVLYLLVSLGFIMLMVGAALTATFL